MRHGPPELYSYTALYTAIHYTAIQRYTLYNLYNTPLLVRCSLMTAMLVDAHARRAADAGGTDAVRWRRRRRRRGRGGGGGGCGHDGGAAAAAASDRRRRVHRFRRLRGRRCHASTLSKTVVGWWRIATLREAVLTAAQQQKEVTIAALRQTNERTASQLSRQQEVRARALKPAVHQLAFSTPLLRGARVTVSVSPVITEKVRDRRLRGRMAVNVQVLRTADGARWMTHALRTRLGRERERSTHARPRCAQHTCGGLTPLPGFARPAVRRWSKPCNRRPNRAAGPPALRAAAAAVAAAAAA